MENKSDKSGNEKDGKTKPSSQENQDAEFENPSVDPGFETDDRDALTGEEDEREHNIGADKSISKMRQENEEQNNDALNYKNDRENGAYNPKNI